MNFKCFYVESENGRKWDAFSSFVVVLFSKRNKTTHKKQKKIYGDSAYLRGHFVTCGNFDPEVQEHSIRPANPKSR